MAQPQPHLLSRGDIRRVNDCVAENVKLADCWKSDQVVIVAVEPTGAHLSNPYVLMLDILSPKSNPISIPKPKAWSPFQQVCHTYIVPIEKKGGRWVTPDPGWHETHDWRHIYHDYDDKKTMKVEQTFSQLCEQYVTICIASHDLQDSLAALKNFGVKLPANTVHVDLVMVLEHQCRQSGTGPPEQLRKYTDENVAVRNGRYDRRSWPVVGDYGMPCLALLEVLGPAAESHRRDKTEKQDAALKRIVKRMVVDEIPVRTSKSHRKGQS
jgi:hypothetical protein